MPGDLVYFVLPVADQERAKVFYGEVLGWEFEPGTIPTGLQIANTEPPGGVHGGAEGKHPQVFFRVDDVGAAVARIRELGGAAGDPVEIASGWMADCRDDQGTRFSVWAPHA